MQEYSHETAGRQCRAANLFNRNGNGEERKSLSYNGVWAVRHVPAIVIKIEAVPKLKFWDSLDRQRLLNSLFFRGILRFMWLVMIPASCIALAVILYFAISKRSSPEVRRLAVSALALAAIALIVCIVFIATAPSQEAEPGPAALPLPVKPAAPVQKVNWQELLFFGVLLILLLLFLAAFSRRNVSPKTEEKEAAYQDEPGGDDDGRWQRRSG
ncbi:MAG: hypothetical protein LBP81_04095 [Treponema sp.]|jgi:Na+/melibiose symporter-like transporter|nr:hypothetical protein [Treponema sp.]